MLRLSILSTAIFILFLNSNSSWAGKPTGEKMVGTVIDVVDGDTVWINKDGGYIPQSKPGVKKLGEKIRMVGLDTPETDFNGQSQGPWGEMAKVELSKLVFKQKVEIALEGKDPNGRTLGRMLKDGVDAGLEMIKRGLAAAYVICDHEECNEQWEKEAAVHEYLKACELAQDKKLGFYSELRLNDVTVPPLEKLPFEFRILHERNREDNRRPPTKWLGNIDTKTYYQRTWEDYKKVPPCKRVFFFKEEFATASGYKAAS